jgi:hypothetical protein
MTFSFHSLPIVAKSVRVFDPSQAKVVKVLLKPFQSRFNKRLLQRQKGGQK